MTKSNYLKDYAESFAIFAKYEPTDLLDLDYFSIGVDLIDDVTPEDEARLLELGWDKGGSGLFYRYEQGKKLDDFS